MNDRQLDWAKKEKLRIAKIEEDLENLKPLNYVKDVKVVAKIKKHWWKEEKSITLNSDVSIDAIIQILEKELDKKEVFYSVVTEDDFFKFKCSHDSRGECDRSDCRCCNCSFDFYDSDITKILKERAGYVLEVKDV